MELDDLKNILSRADGRNFPGLQQFASKKTPPFDPFREIKIRLIWIIIFFVVTTIIFSPFLFIPPKRNFFIDILYIILSVESLISLIGFLLIKSLEKTGMNIKQTLIRRIRSLRTIYNSYVYLNAVLYIVLSILIEINIHNHGIFDGMGKIVLPIRIIIYGLFIMFQSLQKQRSYQRNYGFYLSSMINLLQEANEE